MTKGIHLLWYFSKQIAILGTINCHIGNIVTSPPPHFPFPHWMPHFQSHRPWKRVFYSSQVIRLTTLRADYLPYSTLLTEAVLRAHSEEKLFSSVQPPQCLNDIVKSIFVCVYFTCTPSVPSSRSWKWQLFSYLCSISAAGPNVSLKSGTCIFRLYSRKIFSWERRCLQNKVKLPLQRKRYPDLTEILKNQSHLPT